MFLLELKKTWKRPEVLIAFFIICMIQGAFVWKLVPAEEKKYLDAHEKYGGQMDEEWKVGINSAYKEYLENEDKSPDEVNPYQPDYRTLRNAWYYTDFNGMVEDYVERYQAGMAQRDPSYDTDRISQAYRELKEQSDQLIFGNCDPRVIMVKSLSMLSRCIIMFLVFLLASLFTREQDTGMDAILSVSRNGGRKLDYIKLAVCQSSALWTSVILIGLSAVIIYIHTGWAGLDAVVQDFISGQNTCPYVWNNGRYLAVILLITLLTCQAVAAVIFVLSRYIKTTVKIICIALGILLVPVLLFENYRPWLLGFWFPNLIAGEYLWNNFYEIRIGQIYLSYWKIALTGLAVLFVALICIFLRMGKERKVEGFHSIRVSKTEKY